MIENKEELKHAKELHEIAKGMEKRIKQQDKIKVERFVWSSNVSICVASLIMVLLIYSDFGREYFHSLDISGVYAREYFLWFMLFALGILLVFLYGFNKQNLLLFFGGGLLFGLIECLCTEWYFLRLPFGTDVIWHYGYSQYTITPIPLWVFPAWGIIILTIRRIDFGVLRR